MKTRFYYLRDKQNTPRVTICIGVDYKGKFSRGVALCSFKDTPLKKNIIDKKTGKFITTSGRFIAENRAAQAFLAKESTKIIFSERGKNILMAVGDRELFYKSEYDVLPRSSFETKLFKSLLKETI